MHTTETAGMEEDAEPALVQQPRLWQDETWTARVIKNEDDDGWAVSMTRRGEAEAALVGPWTMGRDKKNPKPLDAPAFHTLVKAASEVLRRHEQQLHARLHKRVTVRTPGASWVVTLDIVPGEDEAYAVLAALDDTGTEHARVKVEPGFKLNGGTAQAWVEAGFQRPG